MFFFFFGNKRKLKFLTHSYSILIDNYSKKSITFRVQLNYFTLDRIFI